MNATTSKDEPLSAGQLVSKSGPRTRTIAVIDNRIDSGDLFASTRELIIGHGSDHYRLRLTSQNKLILTK